jgi:ubiquinol-cytochrome c reductase cytochrome b subunit
MRSPEGGYSERHLPLSPARAYTMTVRDRDPDVLAELDGAPDVNGVEPRGGIAARLAAVRHRLRTLMYADNVQKPTLDELEEGHHHAEHEHELQAPMEGLAADGHQFDGHHLVEGEKLRSHD